MKVNYLDCCSDPDLDSVKVILDTNRESEDLVRCKTCGVYWFQRFLEIMNFDGPDDQTVWYSPVMEEEARRLTAGRNGRPKGQAMINGGWRRSP